MMMSHEQRSITFSDDIHFDDDNGRFFFLLSFLSPYLDSCFSFSRTVASVCFTLQRALCDLYFYCVSVDGEKAVKARLFSRFFFLLRNGN